MKTIPQLAEEIVAREGGFVNDPSDPGGATNWGVTIGTMKRLGIDVNHDGRVDITDVKVLPRAQAIAIYVKTYFTDAGLDRLPAQLQPGVYYAAELAAEAKPNALADAYAVARRNYYYALADSRPASRKYARRRDGGKGGWITRAEEFMSPALRLTEAEHRARVANWP